MPERALRPTRRELVQRLPSSGRALAQAREMVESLEELSRPVRDDLALLVTELVGNSLRHAGLGEHDWVGLRLVLQTGSVRVEVTDPGPGFSPVRTRPGPSQTSGRGLYLVEQVADRWGLERGGETCVWFELWTGESRTRHRLRSPDHIIAPADLASMSVSQLKESLGVLVHDERDVSAERNALHERIRDVRGELESRGTMEDEQP